MIVSRIRVCSRSFGFFLLAKDPADSHFLMEGPVVAERDEAEAMKAEREGKPFVPGDWRRNPRAVRKAA
jgi:hypothetical protein